MLSLSLRGTLNPDADRFTYSHKHMCRMWPHTKRAVISSDRYQSAQSATRRGCPASACFGVELITEWGVGESGAAPVREGESVDFDGRVLPRTED